MATTNFRYVSRDKCVSDKKIVTNPRYPNFKHRILTIGDEEQFYSSRTYESLNPANPILLQNNQFKSETLIKPWEKNKDITSRAISDTFKYLFHKFKKGLFIKIENNKIVTFLPFINVHYKNEWHTQIHVDPQYKDIQAFINQSYKLAGYSSPKKIKPIDEWVSNNSIIRFDFNELNNNNVEIIYDMFQTLCEKRKVADVEFFVNRRDFPQITRDGTEPYNHLYSGKDISLKSHEYAKYAPILSGSSNDRFADIMMPTFEDWARVVYQTTNMVMPNVCKSYPPIKQIPWKDKIAKAVFRGSTTGAGSTPDTNQRLKVLEINDPKYMDVGITKWNLRPRKHETDDYFKLISRKTYPKVAPLDLQEQSKYKYILTLEGHVAAYRLSYELSSGSVILLADSEWKLWYYKFLTPWVHYVPVAHDLSDLIVKIRWCQKHDKKCEQIASNALKFYKKYLNMNSVLDYLQKELYEISSITGPYEYLPNLLETQIEDETEQLRKIQFRNEIVQYAIKPGPRCIGRLDGGLKLFQSVPFSTFRPIKHIATNKNGVVNLAYRNGIFVAVKTATNPGKAREHRHEAYIGLHAINSIIADIPNFTYTYGMPRNIYNIVVSEYIQGIPMNEWISSSNFTFESYINILIQLNMALKVAQDRIGFIHYDLFPWNIIIQTLPQKVEFDYHVKPNLVLRVTTDTIPIIIDYGKSRAIVYEENIGLVDHGFVNLYRSNAMLDTITLLITSLNLLKPKLSPHQFNTLQSYLIHVKLKPDTLKYRYYGDLFTMPATKLTPIDFVDFLVTKFKFKQPQLQQINPLHKSYKMERGNPIHTFEYMKTGSEKKALMKILNQINESTFPNSTDEFYQRIIMRQLERRLSTIIEDINTKGSYTIRTRWKTIWGYMNKFYKPTVRYPQMDFPTPDYIYLDSDIDPQYVKTQLKTAIPVHENMAVIWKMCADAYLWESNEGKNHIQRFVDTGGFNYLNAIASQNTLIKIAGKLK